MIRLSVFSSWIIYMSGFCTALTVQDGTNAVIPCTEGQHLPGWEGPIQNGTVITYNHFNRTTFNPSIGNEKLTRLSWADNNIDLLLSPARRTDEGIYTCWYFGGRQEVSLTVLIRPSTPVISNTVSGGIIWGTEGTSLTLSCSSVGGYPVQTVIWYTGSTPVQPPGTYNVAVSNGLNNVILNYTFTPKSADDGVTYKCQSSFTGELPLLQSSSVQLVLNLRPSELVLSLIGSPIDGSGATDIATCSTGGFRPRDISISWTFAVESSVEVANLNPVNNSNKFSVITNYSRAVFRADNGKQLTCSVLHQLTSTKLSTTRTLNVLFGPLSTIIEGNVVIVANGQNTLTLTCRAGNANPLSSIHWTYYSINSTQPVLSDYTSDYGGRIAHSVVTFKPSRNDDGKNVTCTAINTLNRPATSTVMLNLNYRPEISPIPTQTAVEGESHELPCVAHSKPPATFSWYRNGLLLHQTSGTSSANQGPYTISSVNRSHTGIYACSADNYVLNKDERNVTLTVQYPPDITVVVQNTSSMTNVSQLICSASGVPNRYTFSSTWSQDWPGYGSIRDWTGNYNTLTLNQLTYEHSGIYACSATNGIKVFGKDQQYMRGAGYLLVKDVPVITWPAVTPHRVTSEVGKHASITLHVYSNSFGEKVSVFKVLNDSRGSSSVGSVNMSPTTVQLPVFNHIVPIDGILINISILMEQAEDFGLYEAVVSNAIGNRTIRINVEAQDKVSPESSSKAGMIAGSIVGGLIGLLTIVMTVIALRKYELMFMCKCVRRQESTGRALYEASAISAIKNGEYDSLGIRNDIRNSTGNDNELGTNAYDSLDPYQSKHVYSELGRQPRAGNTRLYANTAEHLDSGTAVYVNTTFENA